MLTNRLPPMLRWYPPKLPWEEEGEATITGNLQIPPTGVLKFAQGGNGRKVWWYRVWFSRWQNHPVERGRLGRQVVA